MNAQPLCLSRAREREEDPMEAKQLLSMLQTEAEGLILSVVRQRELHAWVEPNLRQVEKFLLDVTLGP